MSVFGSSSVACDRPLQDGVLRWLCVLSVATALKHSPSKRKSISRPVRGALETETGDGTGECNTWAPPYTWKFIRNYSFPFIFQFTVP
jgi:hypothetical protein